MMTHPFFSKRTPWFAVVILVANLLSAQSSGPVFPDPGKPHMSREQQRELGLQAAAQVYQQMPVLPDTSPETQYIRQLGTKLVATIPQQYSWPFEFHVIPQKEINAFALPGGPMFVNIGTITAAKDEAELAGVMAHEMSHVYMQHSAKQASKAETTGLLAGLAGAVLGATVGGMGGQLAQMGIQYGAEGLMLKYSRTDESQADAVGAIILYKAGYNPQALADFFKTLETQGGAPPQILSDHPNPGNRELAIEQEIKNWPPKQYASDSPAFQKTKQHAMGVKAYTGQEIAAGAKSGQWAALNQKNGATFAGAPASAPANVSAASNSGPSTPAPAVAPKPGTTMPTWQSVAPSQHLTDANLGLLTISHPDNWQINPPREKGADLTITPPAGVTTSGVGYGVLINGAQPAKGRRLNIDVFTGDLLKEIEKSDSAKPIGELQTITVAGVEGRCIALQSASPFTSANGQPQEERDWLVTLPSQDGTILYFVFVAPQSEFERLRPTYEAMLKSVRF
jgi:hypothetical protein